MKHGDRSASSRAAWRELNAALRALSQHDSEQPNALDGLSPASPNAPREEWVRRIADELRLSGLSRELILARIRSIGYVGS